MIVEVRRAFVPRGKSEMEKINLPFFYQLGAQLNPLTKMKVEPQTRLDILLSALTVRDSINALFNWSAGLKVCLPSARALLKAVDDASNTWKIMQSGKEQEENVVKLNMACQYLIEKAKTFEIVLSEELPTLSAYCATQTGIYSTADLIDRAEKGFPPPVLAKLNDSVIYDITQAGKCLAFDVPTACGFHMLRATEEVLYQYYLAVCKPRNKKKLDNHLLERGKVFSFPEFVYYHF